MPARRVVWHGVGVRAYAPDAFKVLASGDGANFKEAVDWRAPADSGPSFVETVMFSAANVKAIAIVMQAPRGWPYLGITVAAPLVEPAAFMMASASPGERCLVARDGGIHTDECMAAIAAGDGREVFSFGTRGEVRSALTGTCLVVADGDTANGGRLGLEDCSGALAAGDGRSDWGPAAGGRLQAQYMGGHCLGAVGGEAALADCSDDGERDLGGEAFVLVAIPGIDAALASSARDAAALLAAAAARQARLLSQLRQAVSASSGCKLVGRAGADVELAVSAVGADAARLTPGSGESSAAERAVSQICSALGVDMAAVQDAISDSARFVGALREEVGQL